MLLVTVVLTVKYAVMPNIERYQGDIVSRVASLTGMDVSATAIRGGWAGFRPYVELENVVFREQADATTRVAGAEALRLPQLQASLSWWSLFMRQVRFADFALAGPELVLSRGKDGLIYFAGRALNQTRDLEDDGRFLEVLLDQPGISIHHASLTWSDELSPGPSLKFTDVGLSLEKLGSGHAFGFAATPPAGLAKRVALSGLVGVRNEGGRWKVAGTIFTSLEDANLSEIRRHLTIPDKLHSGIGNVRAWVDIDNAGTHPTAPGEAPVSPAAPGYNPMTAFDPVRAITADVNIVNARAQLATDLAPLQVAKLAGRIEYVAQKGGLTLRSKGLEFRTREGVSSPPADFSMTLQNQSDATKASGDVTANGIDLKVLTALLEYFPIPKDLRAVAARFSPRGVVQQSEFSWTGYLERPVTYRVRGKLTEFGSQSDEAMPGISGFSGTVEGDEKGGRFTVVSKDLQLDAPLMFRAPLKFASVDGEGRWQVTPDVIDVTLGSLKFANDDLAGDFAGRYWRYRAGGARAAEEKGPGTLDIKGKFDRIKATRVPDYLPNGGAQSREYIEWAVRDGEITGANFLLKGAIYDFPYHQGKGGHFRLDAKVKDIDFRYADGWPDVSDISGALTFENTRFEAKVDAAKIVNAPLKQTIVTVDDFAGKPPLLTIQGSADARAEDVTKYLKESPLIDSVGSFTKFVAIDGPGKLELVLKFPLGVKDQTKVTGKYAVARGHAKVAIGERGIDISSLNGGVVFTESSVKSTGLAGIAYGNPIAINIAGAGDAGVTVDFSARADIAQMDGLLPFRMPQQVAGISNFAGRILAKAGATEVAIESTLAGIASALPSPLAKRAEEVRILRVAFNNTGLPNEKIRITLAGNAVAQNSTGEAPQDNAETRIDARFQRRFDSRGIAQGLSGGIVSSGDALGEITTPDGLWFAGTLPRLDFDAWRKVIADHFSPPAAGAIPTPAAVIPPLAGAKTTGDIAVENNDSPIAGFDFKLGSLVAYGRKFNAMTLKGRHGTDGWRMNVNSAEASGDFTWRSGAYSDRGSVRARLQRFTLADEMPVVVTAATPAPLPVELGKEADFPALDIIAEKFTFKDRDLGKLELRATPQGANWKIDQLDITNGHAKLEMKGLWQRFGDPQNPAGKSRTTMSLSLDTANLNALFDQFGFGDHLKGGRARLEGQLSWPGHATQFQTSLLSGNFAVEATDGRFAKIKPGAGKLLGLISLQSLPRRITLDFRDVFSEGFAFDKITGDMKINNGIIFTENFEIRGPAAEIRMVGDVSLPNENQNLIMTVKPSLGEGVAIGAAVLLTPVVGAGVLLAQKMLQGASTHEYAVTGPWDDPHVDMIKQSPASRGAAPAAPSAPAGAGATELPRKTP